MPRIFISLRRCFAGEVGNFTYSGASMHAHLTHSEAPRALTVEPSHNDLHPGRGVIASPSHDDIANRAYDIYVKNGCQQGQCEKNWHQAELELRTNDDQP
jgi:Protein of unknown function (DUF2934)